jgi:hypothetical protein
MPSLKHLAWIPAGAGTSFLASFLFGDLLTLPVDLYYLIYFAIIVGFLLFYVSATGLELRPVLSRRLLPAMVLGAVVALAMVRNVLARPPTEPLAGAVLVWALGWRGVVYGLVDGLILHAFPWLVVWRALGAEEGGYRRKVQAGFLAWAAILLVTTAYHLGYSDFRSRKIVQPNVGSTIMSVPTLLSANPVASLLPHVALHVTAVVHSPETDLFLPPHRNGEGEPQ